MNARRLALVGLGLIGIWLVAEALMMFATFSRVGEMSSRGFIVAAGIPLALILGFSYVLVFHNAQLARTIAPDPAATIEFGSADLARVLFALLGVVLLSEAIPSVLNLIIAIAMMAGQEFGSSAERAGPIRALLSAAAKGAIGWYLIANPERLLAIVRRPLRETAD